MSFVLNRKTLRISGKDATKFLGDLITNELPKGGELTYAALLSPQGKYLFDFFLYQDGDDIILDVDADQAAPLKMRLSMYRLRAEVQIEEVDLKVSVGTGPVPQDGFPDPRDPALGWRVYSSASNDAGLDWNALYVENIIPRTGVELIAEQTYILEAGFDRLNGVDFKKGCYVGQEVTARMRHKTELRKGLVRVNIDGRAEIGTSITRDGKNVGVLYSQANGLALAHLRFDMMGEGMVAGDATITPPDVS